MTTALGDFGAPPDAVAWASLALGAAIAVALRGSMARRILLVSDRVLVSLLAGLAAALSLLYVAVYLRGGPRIIDATTYFLEARTLAEGHLGFTVLSPTGSFRGRFLLASPDGHVLRGIFPPGYPAVLALGFLASAPMLVGPAIAAGIVVVTHALSLRLFDDRRIALLAAALSVVCAVLRYHTADTMSHGWAALLLATALWSSLGESRGSAWFSGACAGWLVATRPMSGAVALALVALASRRAPSRVARVTIAAAFPCLLLATEQRVATGAWLEPTQLAYYAVADGPPGCFRYGFGPSIGCLFEHGDFVRAHLAHGYGVLAALGTTLRRLKMHLSDAGNLELFFAALVYSMAAALRGGRGRLAAMGVLGIVLVYVPFYFDGNFPGGGARFYADALPLEHVLLAWGLHRLQLARVALPAALAGFSLHTAYDHRRLADREGGRPLFEESALLAAGVHRGLVFVDTDHGFNLGHDPGARSASTSVVVARRRGDAHDAILWDQLGRPHAFVYEVSTTSQRAAPRVLSLTLGLARTVRLEAEAEWPPLSVEGGFVEPVFPACASGHRALALRPPSAAGRMRLEVAAPSPGRYRITTTWVTPASGWVGAQVTLAGKVWSIVPPAHSTGCFAVEGPSVDLPRAAGYLDISSSSEAILDYVELSAEP